MTTALTAVACFVAFLVALFLIYVCLFLAILTAETLFYRYMSKKMYRDEKGVLRRRERALKRSFKRTV